MGLTINNSIIFPHGLAGTYPVPAVVAYGPCVLDRFYSFVESSSTGAYGVTLTLPDPTEQTFPYGATDPYIWWHFQGAPPVTVRNTAPFALQILNPDSTLLGTMNADGATCSWAVFAWDSYYLGGHWKPLFWNSNIWTPP